MKTFIFFISFGIIVVFNHFGTQVNANPSPGGGTGTRQQQTNQGQGSQGPFWAARGRRSGYSNEIDSGNIGQVEDVDQDISKIRFLPRVVNPDRTEDLILPSGDSLLRRIPPYQYSPSQILNTLDDSGMYYVLLNVNKKSGNSNPNNGPDVVPTFWAARG